MLQSSSSSSSNNNSHSFTSNSNKRVILHFDLDAFYAQVEQVRLGLPKDVSLAVQQWRGLIAVNYPSRAFGVKRFMSMEDVKKICPDIIFVHTATYAEGDSEPKYHPNPHPTTHKVSLDVYRNASRRVMAIFQRFFKKFQRASVDEAYVDVTDEVHARVELLYKEAASVVAARATITTIIDDQSSSSSDTNAASVVARATATATTVTDDQSPSSDNASATTSTSTTTKLPIPWNTTDANLHVIIDTNAGSIKLPWKGAGVLVGEPVEFAESHNDIQLRVAADLAHEVRATVLKELDYTVSAGVAHNKTLAKLCSALNKPNNQTIMREDEVLAFMEDLPLEKIRFMGGKLGSEVEEKLGAEKAGDVWKYPLATLKAKLGETSGVWVYDISRGICREPVQQTPMQKSFGANKNIRPPAANLEGLMRWLDMLCGEVYYRMMEEFDNTRRWPKTLTLHLRKTYQPSQSRSCPIPPRFKLLSPDVLRNLALQAMTPNTEAFLPLSGLGLVVSGLSKEEQSAFSLKDYFTDANTQRQQRLQQQSPKTDTIMNPSSDTDSNNHSHQIDLHVPANISLAHSLPPPPPTTEPIQIHPLPPQKDDDSDFQIQCDECGKRIPIDEETEHADFHFAMKLMSKTFQDSSSNNHNTQQSDGSSSKVVSKKRKAGANSKDAVLGHPPPSKAPRLLTTFFQPKPANSSTSSTK